MSEKIRNRDFGGYVVAEGNAHSYICPLWPKLLPRPRLLFSSLLLPAHSYMFGQNFKLKLIVASVKENQEYCHHQVKSG